LLLPDQLLPGPRWVFPAVVFVQPRPYRCEAAAGCPSNRSCGTTTSGATVSTFVAQVEVIQVLDEQIRVQCGGIDIDAFGNLPLPGTGHLATEQTMGLPIACHP